MYKTEVFLNIHLRKRKAGTNRLSMHKMEHWLFKNEFCIKFRHKKERIGFFNKFSDSPVVLNILSFYFERAFLNVQRFTNPLRLVEAITEAVTESVIIKAIMTRDSEGIDQGQFVDSNNRNWTLFWISWLLFLLIKEAER